jgi:serine/threonine protein kinase
MMIGGRYQLQRPLGSGGMAEVWLATDLRLDSKQVAVKRLHGFRAGAPNATNDLERARREAFAASRLSHPNLVAVTDFIAEHGEPFIVMEYVEGPTLDELCHGDGLPTGRSAHLIGQVAAALSEAHAAHIVHRDVKPANIIVTPRGDAKLADFGIARSPGDPRNTATGAFTGTMRYLAPEVLDGKAAGPAGDVWALGATLYEAVEGRPAFDAPTNVGLIAAIAMGPVPMLTRSPELAPIVAHMLDREPEHRPTAAEVAARLRPLSLSAATGPVIPWDARFARAGVEREVQPSDATVQATPRPATPPPARPRSRPKKRTRAWMVVAVPVVVAATAGGIVLSTTGNGGNEPLAGGNPPTVVRTSHGTGASTSLGNGGPAPTETSSSPVIVGVGPPGGGPPGTAHFAGVTVRHARDRLCRPAAQPRPQRCGSRTLSSGTARRPLRTPLSPSATSTSSTPTARRSTRPGRSRRSSTWTPPSRGSSAASPASARSRRCGSAAGASSSCRPTSGTANSSRATPRRIPRSCSSST